MTRVCCSNMIGNKTVKDFTNCADMRILGERAVNDLNSTTA